jgi:hypothetical protein
MRRGKASPKTSRARNGIRARNNEITRYNGSNLQTVHLFDAPGQIMFPPRLRVRGRVAFNAMLTYTAAPNSYQYITLNNPITVVSGQNVSGLRWLISGQQTNGTSVAPYAVGIVRSAIVEVYAKTASAPNSNTGALVTLYPLSPGTTVSTLSLTQAEEQFGRSNIIELPLGLDTVSHSRPLITKRYNLWDLVGVTEQSYMNNYALYGFGYAGTYSGAVAIEICLQIGLESAANDTTYSARTDVIVTLEMELFNRNVLVSSAPSS